MQLHHQEVLDLDFANCPPTSPRQIDRPHISLQDSIAARARALVTMNHHSVLGSQAITHPNRSIPRQGDDASTKRVLPTAKSGAIADIKKGGIYTNETKFEYFGGTYSIKYPKNEITRNPDSKITSLECRVTNTNPKEAKGTYRFHISDYGITLYKDSNMDSPINLVNNLKISSITKTDTSRGGPRFAARDGSNITGLGYFRNSLGHELIGHMNNSLKAAILYYSQNTDK